jgi:cardiolipin synthase
MEPAYYRDYLEYAIGIPFTDGNQVAALANGRNIFPAMLEAVGKARRSVDFLTYVYWGGDTAVDLASALAERSRNGVRVRVLLDSFGSKSISRECLDILTESGIELRWFRPLRALRFWRGDKRTHRKILVVDDVVGFTGGVGIADEWAGDARNAGEWRETHFRFEGPAIGGLNAAFMDNWNEAGGWTISGPEQVPSRHDDGVPVQVLRSGSTVQWTEAASLIRALVCMAQARIAFVTPFFVPDETLTDVLRQAAQRGVDIEIMLPGDHADSRLSQLAGYPCIETLLDAGVRIYRYNRTLLHLKLVVVDETVVSVGSANLNHRSMGKDEECNANVLSPALAQQLLDDFYADMDHAEAIDLESWRKRSLWLRLQERLSRLIVEQL